MAVKNGALKLRWKKSKIASTVRLGMAKMIRKEVTSICQTYRGILNRLIPGARKFKIVTIKLIEPAVDPRPVMKMPKTQKSIPCEGEKFFGGQRRIGKPTRIGSASQEERAVH